MASIQKTPAGQYRAQVYIAGQRASRVLPTLRDAREWAAKTETTLRARAQGKSDRTKTLADALDRYSKEVTPTRKGWRREMVTLQALPITTEKHTGLPGSLRLVALTPEHLAAWRDARLREVKPGTVLRELGLLGAVLETARREWRWIEANPVRDIKGPPTPQHRERVISRREIRLMLRALDYNPRRRPMSMKALTGLAFLLALRTGMRSGEISAVRWADYTGATVTLHTSKTGEGRDVPISSKARRLVERVRGVDDAHILPIAPQTRDTLFRRARDRAGLAGFTFHDTRHTAATWIGRSGRLTLMEMCKMFGWRDPKHALVYFNPTGADLAAKLG